MSNNIELIMLSSLLHSDEYRLKITPHLKDDYFEDESNKKIFKIVKNYIDKHHQSPTREVIEAELESASDISESTYQSASEITNKITSPKAKESVDKISFDWLKEKSESHCQYRAAYLAVLEALDVIDNKKKNKGSILEIMKKAVSVSFNLDIGMDYFEGAEEQFDYYHEKVVKIPTPLAALNILTKGGLEFKTLNFIVAPTGVGKTNIMTYFTSFWLKNGYDVSYITLEESQNKIRERIDQAVLDMTSEELRKYPKDVYLKMINKLKTSGTAGKLVVKEFPTSSIGANNIRAYLEEVKNKKGFKPRILVLDYLNLLRNAGGSSGDNTYSKVKEIAEEIRGLAMELDICILTATQTNRGGQGSSDFDLTEVSESHGVSMTADFMLAAISTETLEQMNQIRLKILKSRYGKKDISFMAGINREKMILFDIDIVKDTIDTNTKTLEQTKTNVTESGFVIKDKGKKKIS